MPKNGYQSVSLDDGTMKLVDDIKERINVRSSADVLRMAIKKFHEEVVV